MVLTARYNLFIMCLSLLIGVIPILAGFDFSYLNTQINNDAIEEDSVAFASYALIFSTFPILLDLSFEMMSSRAQKVSTKSSDHNLTRMLLTISSLVIAILTFLSSNSPSQLVFSNKPAVILVAKHFCNITFGCSLMYGLCISKPEVFTPKQTIAVSFITAVVFVIRIYTEGTNDLMDYLSSIFVSIVAIVLVGIHIYWARKMSTWEFKSVDEKASLFYCSLVYITVLTFVIAVVFGYVTTNSFAVLTISDLLMGLYGRVILNILLSVVPGQILKVETIKAKVSSYWY